MDINYKQIRAYMDCPLKYHLIYDRRVDYVQPIREKFDECMRKTILFYYYSIMNENVVTQEQLKQKWGQLWFKNVTANDIMLREEPLNDGRADNIRKLELDGVSMILNFYRQNQFKKVLPIAIDYRFELDIGRHRLIDSLELIRQVKDNEKGDIVEIVNFRTSEYKPDMFLTTHDAKLSMLVYAYRRLFNMREQRILYHFLKGGKEIYSYRDDDEMRRFEVTVNRIASAIEGNIIYPNHSHLCASCPVRVECNKYKF